MKRLIIILLLISTTVVGVSAQTSTRRQYVGPFTNARITNFIKKIDKYGDELLFVSGSNPAYYYARSDDREYFFAGEMLEDNILLSGDLMIFTPYGWTEQIGYFNEHGTHEVGCEFHHSYFSNEYPEMIFRTTKQTKIWNITDESAMYGLIEGVKKIEFDDEDFPKSVKPLPLNLTPKIFTKDYCIKKRREQYSKASLVTSSKPKQLTDKGKLVTFATIAAAIGLAAKAFSDDRGSSSSSSSSSSPSNKYSMSNVEIVDWGTLGSLAYSHAMVVLRNKNNYDVNVSVGLYQGKWGNGSIVYSSYENTDRIPGVSDEFSKSIRVKANSMRTVYLRGVSRGRPTHIQISSVR